MKTIMDSIFSIEECVFSYDIKGLEKKFMEFTNEMELLMQALPTEKVQLVNNLLNHIVNAMMNKDYLFMADILRYEILPIYSDMTVSGGH